MLGIMMVIVLLGALVATRVVYCVISARQLRQPKRSSVNTMIVLGSGECLDVLIESGSTHRLIRLL